MPKLKNRLPKRCNDRGRAFSWHNGKRIYHGVWGSPEAEKNYKRFISALLENPELRPQIGDVEGVLVMELCEDFMEHIEAGNKQKAETRNIKMAVGYLIRSYGELPADEFSPKKLKSVRDQMIKAGSLCRGTINMYVNIVRRIFSWGVEEETVSATVIHSISPKIVKPLRKGAPGTFDHPEREAVSNDIIAATLLFLPPTVAAMVQVQWLTGMRPSEVFNMRVGEITRCQKNGLWYKTPSSHKTEEHIRKKPIPQRKPEQDLIAP
jgi:integrase